MSNLATVLAQRSNGWETRSTDINKLCGERNELEGLTVVFLPPETRKDDLQKAFSIPPCTLEEHHVKSTGFFDAKEWHNASESGIYSTSFRFLIKMLHSNKAELWKSQPTTPYDWIELGFWTEWQPNHSSVLLCSINDDGGCNGTLQAQFAKCLGNSKVSLTFPFAWHAFLLEQVIVPCFDRSVWECRDMIRSLETKRPTIEDHLADYTELHEAARHSFHIVETTSMAVEVVNSIIEELNAFWEDWKSELLEFCTLCLEAGDPRQGHVGHNLTMEQKLLES